MRDDPLVKHAKLITYLTVVSEEWPGRVDVMEQVALDLARALRDERAQYAEALELIVDLTLQGAAHAPVKSLDDHDLISHCCISAYEDAFDYLEMLGLLRYVNEARFWAELDWGALARLRAGGEGEPQ
jgi:hypothetical protein